MTDLPLSDNHSATEPATPSGDLGDGSRGAKFRERRDAVTGKVMDDAQLIRFVVGPDGFVVPDIAAKLPGRGIWVAADRESINTAAKKGAFSRSAKTKAIAPDGLADQCDALLARSVLGLLGMANRAGQIESGFDKVRAYIQVDPPAWRICANDAARDGRNKIRVASKAAWEATPLLACFGPGELGKALGREDVTHAVLKPGRLAKKFKVEARRLGGFRNLIPNDWETELEDAKSLLR